MDTKHIRRNEDLEEYNEGNQLQYTTIFSFFFWMHFFQNKAKSGWRFLSRDNVNDKVSLLKKIMRLNVKK